jgi:hypothetical protein
MRILLNVKFPNKEFNSLAKDGSIGQKIKQILQESKPEAVYFTEQNGMRSAILVVDLEHPSQIPTFAEPWFLTFNASVEFKIIMSPEDLEKAGIEKIAKKY